MTFFFSVRQLQGQYVPSSGNVGRVRDFEGSDPAIMKFNEETLAEKLNNASLDMRQLYLSQFNPEEDDARLKLLMQQSQNLRFSRYVGDRYSPQNDSYLTSKLLDQFQPSNPSIYQQLHSQQFNTNMFTSNSLWDGWNNSMNLSGLGMSEVFNDERLLYNNFVSNYDNIKF